MEDVAKRLIDYGFHAPTMSFPVAGTFMIEPTESESLTELDAFCDALIAIRAEVDKVGSGEWDAADNPLKNAPHTAEMLIAGEWKHPYPREDGGYPGGTGARRPASGRAKYWPPVRRIDSAYGDRQPGLRLPAAGGVRLGRRRRRSPSDSGAGRSRPAATPAGGSGPLTVSPA